MRITSLKINNETIHIKRSSRRKTLLLRVIENKIQVNAPLFVSNADIARFVAEHQSWIITQKAQQPKPQSYKQGSEILYLGRPLTIDITKGTRQIFIDKKSLCVYLANPDQLKTKKLVQQFLRAKAEGLLLQRAKIIQQQFNKAATNITVDSFKSRWGCCSQSGLIQLNWRLIHAPLAVIDYVIIHEFCHLYHFNHSKAFWGLVAKHCPEYARHKQWLKQHSQLL